MDAQETRLPADGRPGINRRGLLAGAAGGFALAASGLLLPDWLVEEAEADNHPVRQVQHRKAQRRRKRDKERRRQDDHNGREQPSKKDHDKQWDSDGDLDVEITFSLDPSAISRMGVAFYASTPHGVQLKDNGSVESMKEYRTDKGHAECFLWIDERYFIRVRIPAPQPTRVDMGYGGHLKTQVNKKAGTNNTFWTGGTLVVTEQELDESDPIMPERTVMAVDGNWFEMRYTSDTKDYKRIELFASKWPK